MAYASQSDIETAAGGAVRLVELADWDADGVADATAIAAVQAATDGWIDSYAAVRYAVPVASPTDTLIQVAAEVRLSAATAARHGLGGDEQRHRREAWLVHLSRASSARPTRRRRSRTR